MKISLDRLSGGIELVGGGDNRKDLNYFMEPNFTIGDSVHRHYSYSMDNLTLLPNFKMAPNFTLIVEFSRFSSKISFEFSKIYQLCPTTPHPVTINLHVLVL